jgi:CubicO group peptidase (beta-lactamase class C family)
LKRGGDSLIRPNFDGAVFEKAAGRAKEPLKSGKFDCAALGVWQDGKEMTRLMGPGGKDAPELKNKLILLASISKAITGTAAARLVDQGVIKWSDPLSKYLDDMCGPVNGRITVEDVFLHRTGYADCERFNLGPVPQYEAYRAMLKNGPALKPGTAFMYATTTYWFFSAVVHKTLGFKSMDDFLKEWIFEPCGMTSTTFHPAPERMVDCGYVKDAELEEYMRLEVPGSGLWSNINDLLKFGKAVVNPGFLMGEETFRDMTEALPMRKHDEAGFSARTRGWVKEVNFNSQPQTGFFHGGATGGVLWCDPENEFTAVFMGSKWGSGNEDAFRVIETFYHEER